MLFYTMILSFFLNKVFGKNKINANISELHCIDLSHYIKIIDSSFLAKQYASDKQIEDKYFSIERNCMHTCVY